MLQTHATLHSSVGTDTSPAVRPMSAAQWHASTHTSDNSNRSSSSSGLTSGSSGHARPVYVTMATSPCHVSGPPNSPPRGVAEQRRGIGSHSVSVGTDIVTKKDEGSHTSTLRIDSACSGSAASSPVQRYVPQRFDSQLFTMQLNPLFFEGAADCVAEPAEFSTGDSRASGNASVRHTNGLDASTEDNITMQVCHTNVHCSYMLSSTTFVLLS